MITTLCNHHQHTYGTFQVENNSKICETYCHFQNITIGYDYFKEHIMLAQKSDTSKRSHNFNITGQT